MSSIRVGDRVWVDGPGGKQTMGYVRFAGSTLFAPGFWYGVELTRPVGLNDGTVKGKRYFTCGSGYGKFTKNVRICDDITPPISPLSSARATRVQSEPTTPQKKKVKKKPNGRNSMSSPTTRRTNITPTLSRRTKTTPRRNTPTGMSKKNVRSPIASISMQKAEGVHEDNNNQHSNNNDNNNEITIDTSSSSTTTTSNNNNNNIIHHFKKLFVNDCKIHKHNNQFSACYMSALHSFVHSFSIGFGIRSCLSLLLRIMRLLQTKRQYIFDLEKLLGEQSLKVRVEAVRLGLFFGLFTGAFRIIRCISSRYFNENSKYPVLLGGFVGGLGVLSQPKESRRTFALYVMARFMQCLYNDGKRRGIITPIPHGDTLLFALSSAQVMYAYVMRPETLPPSYHNFIVQTGPIAKNVLTLVRDSNRGIPISSKMHTTISHYMHSVNSSSILKHKIGSTPSIIGCDVLHPMSLTCSSNWIRIFIRAFKQTFPLYASLTFAPMIVLRFFQFMKSPFYHIGKGIISAGRSSTFIGAFVTLYQMTVCTFRKTTNIDHRYEYYLAGFIASASVFLEKKSRRSELGLYTMPRAIDSFFLSLVDRKYMISIPNGEVMLFCLSMGGIMYYNQSYPETLSTLVNTILGWLFNWKDEAKKEMYSPRIVNTSSNNIKEEEEY